jgi:aspartate/methionine/tyrosine aminotransferase
MNRYISNISTPSAIAISDKIRELEAKGEKIAKLQTGEPCFATPQYIKNAAFESLKKNQTQYAFSQGVTELRQEISKYYKDEYSFYINPANILINVGAVNSIYCIFNGLLNAGDELLIVDPSWPQYNNMGILLNAQVKKISTLPTNGRLTPELLSNKISNQTKLVVINNPGNPSGVVYSEEEINAFIQIAKKNDANMIFDEVYDRIVFEGNFKKVIQCSEYQGYKSNIYYVNSFSKTFAMTGWRIGYAFIPDSGMPYCLKIFQNSITNVSTFSQYAAVIALRYRKQHQAEFDLMFQTYQTRWKEIKDLLDMSSYSYIKPQGSFYFLIDAAHQPTNFVETLLKVHKMAVVPGSAYGLDFKSYFRISFAVDEYSYQVLVCWLKKK